jgi:hypothetical protein
MRKQFPVPKGLRTPSFASRYAKLRTLRKLANRKEGERRVSKLIPSGVAVPRTDRNEAVKRGQLPLGRAFAIGTLLLLAFFFWLSLR